MTVIYPSKINLYQDSGGREGVPPPLNTRTCGCFRNRRNGRTSSTIHNLLAFLAMYEPKMRKIGIIRRDMKGLYNHSGAPRCLVYLIGATGSR